ncbi:MAG: LPS export ABC transporter periplasmic protein LptC [Burkholderiaceae bacterium]|jgi:lipopolysaccharide export system protein LptC|nr:LPS export ABC transporter periplasmic protein LptC [Burkholderiaceae bacterium]
MRRRNWDQLAAGVSLALLAALAAGTWYLALQSQSEEARARVRTPAGEPDYFLDDAVFTRIDVRGNPVYRISAEHLLHYPEDGTSVYQSPVLVSVDPDRPRVTVRADQGRSNADGSQTVLTGDVVLVRAPLADEPRMTIRTEKATIYSDTQIARSDQPVRIERGGSVLTGVGMEFDNAARSLKVDSQVTFTWQPPPQTSR